MTAGNDGKTRYSIGEGVFIEEYAFDHCKTIDIISIADETPKLGLRNPFQFCSAMYLIGGSDETDTMYADAGKTEIGSVSGSTGGIYRVPAGVRKIGAGAFAGNTNITGIDFSDSSVEKIDEGAFKGCTGLTELTIPASIKTIGDSAFENCVNLKEINFADETGERNTTLESIGERAFCDCGLDYSKYNETALTDEENGVLRRTADGEKAVKFGTNAFHEHTGWIVTKEATCMASGERKPDCACRIDDTVIIPPLGHDTVHHEAKESTCTVHGCKEYDTCSRCDYSTYEELPLDENKHIETETKVENETFSDCSQAGEYDEVVYCKDCGKELSREHKEKEKDSHIPADAAKENETAATCTAGGHYDSVVYCAVCGEELSREEIKTGATGHNYEEKVTPPTCTEKGYTTHTCAACGDSYKDSETPALGHSFTKYKYNNDATTEEDGTETAKCDRCDAIDTRVKAGTKLPEKPDEPATPDNPEKPDEPATPDNPEKPDEPTTPDKPGNKVPDIEIKNYKDSFEVDYKSKVIISTTISAPEGYEIEWQDGTKGPVYTIGQATQKEYKVQAKLVRLSDRETVKTTHEETIKVNTGFFAKIIAFFRSLFNALPVYEDNRKQ